MADFELMTKYIHQDDVLEIRGRFVSHNNNRVVLIAKTALLMTDRQNIPVRTAAMDALVLNLKDQMRITQLNETGATQDIPSNAYTAMTTSIDDWITDGMP